MTIKQVADMYNVSTKTIKRKFKKLNLGINTSSLLYPNDLQKIVAVLGEPDHKQQLSTIKGETSSLHLNK
jgi:transcriptional antiterminator